MKVRFLSLCSMVVLFCVNVQAYSSTTDATVADVFAFPPPPFISLAGWEEKQLQEKQIANSEAQPNPVKIFSMDLHSSVEGGLKNFYGFLSVSRYDLTYYQSQSFQLHFAAFTFIQNTSENYSGNTDFFFKSALIIADSEIGMRYLIFKSFYLGTGLGIGAYNDIRNQVVKDSIIDRIFIYMELGAMKEFTPFSFLLFNLQLRVAGLRSTTPIVIFDRSKLLNVELFLGWHWEY